MRALLVVLAACGGAGSATSPSTVTGQPPRKAAVEPEPPVDIIATLQQPLVESSWIVPGPAQLVLGGATVQAEVGTPKLEVTVLEAHGDDVRVGVRLEHARFALWVARSQLLAIVARDQRVTVPGARISTGDGAHVALHRGALVERLGKKAGSTRVRYLGAFEIEGWLPDDAVSERAPTGQRRTGRVPTGKKPVMLRPGAIVRTDPTWAASQLAVMSQGYFVDLVKDLEDGWAEISYEDGDITVRGYVSRRDPPGRTSKRPASEPLPALATNATARDGTCLYVAGEPVGFIVGDRSVVLDKTRRPGWYTLTIDTPWSAIAFDVRGATDTELDTCAE